MPTEHINEFIDLDINLMKHIKNVPHRMPHQRLGDAVKFVDGIIKQLSPEVKKLFEEDEVPW